MQVDGTLKAGALLPPLSASEESGDDDLGAEEGDEEEEQYLGQVRRVKQKETTQPSLKAAAQHRKQRLRELQEEYELAATLGSYTGEKGVSCIQWNCLHILQPPKADQIPEHLKSRAGYKASVSLTTCRLSIRLHAQSLLQ